MSIFRNVVFLAAVSGLLAGIVMAALQSFATDPLIWQAETYESAGASSAHDHGAGEAAPGHHDDGEAWAPADGLERFAFSALMNVVSAVGFALVLVAASEFAGGIGSWRHGLFWGFAGFAVFTLAPGLGLPPELPAMPAADLVERQAWWIGTAAATAAGLAMIAFRRSLLWALGGVALIVAPHLIGAPQPASYETPVPEELHHRFVVAVTVTNLVFWLVLGAAVGFFRGRLLKPADGLQGRFA